MEGFAVAVLFGAELGVDVDGGWEVADVVGGGVEVMLARLPGGYSVD